MSPGSTQRQLLVTADDFGIGPETSRGILDLAAAGVVTSTVLLVNSPHAVGAVGMWHKTGRPIELGWHPCLTLDAPVLPAHRVPSLVGADGHFLRLGSFLKRLLSGRVRRDELEAELLAQYRRFLDLVGAPPANVNAHHHLHVFRPIDDILTRVLTAGPHRPYVRRVAEPRRTLWAIPGGRVKRAVLTHLGRRSARRQAGAGFPGNDTLAGITDPAFVHDPAFFARWLATIPGRFVELSCHPGHLDPTLDGRDGTLTDGQIHRRPYELAQLADPAFRAAVRANGFELVTAGPARLAHAA